jgi:hypothetical protein
MALPAFPHIYFVQRSLHSWSDLGRRCILV